MVSMNRARLDLSMAVPQYFVQDTVLLKIKSGKVFFTDIWSPFGCTSAERIRELRHGQTPTHRQWRWNAN